MPTKRLPASPDLDHLKHQAKDLLADFRTRKLDALQRIREFHPRFHAASDAEIGAAELALSDAHLAIAREYGFDSWPRLKKHVESGERAKLDRPYVDRIDDEAFRAAVMLADDGDLDGLREHLARHPDLVHKRVALEGGNYFREPALLEFVAENPIRHESMRPNVVEIARAILDAGAKSDQRTVDATLELVCSGRVPRECRQHVPLVDLLCDYGADPNAAMNAALVHGEFEAVDALLRRGAALDLPAAAALGRVDAARRMLGAADRDARHRALALAAQFGHAEIVRLLLDAGESTDRYNPLLCHGHTTPLHQAAVADHLEVVRVLVERGARLDIRDILHHATPLGWALHAGRADVAAYLRAHGAKE
jgi:ankyrin repeat protein